MVQELENMKLILNGLCTAHKEENQKITAALNNFLERYDDIYKWLVTIAEAFLQGHQDMGGDLRLAEDFLELHNHLQNDLQVQVLNEYKTLNKLIVCFFFRPKVMKSISFC